MWRDVVGFEGRYQVSDSGEVRSLDFTETVANRWGSKTTRARKGRLLSPQAFPNGYLRVNLGAGNCSLVHRLVAQAFVAGDQSLQVNHKNGNRADNRSENLEWLTCSDNHRHSYRELGRKQHTLTQEVEVNGLRFPSVLAASRALGVVPGSVASAATRSHRCKGMGVAYV